jgi:adenosine deaminase
MLHHAAHVFTPSTPPPVLPDNYIDLAALDSQLHERLFDKMMFFPSLAVSISNDDPGFWAIDAITSYDWYIAVLAWDLSLGAMKQLAMDSIVHSGLSREKRVELLLDWEHRWMSWIRELQ